ncbi:MAG: arabinose-5-phosphate isomerase [Alphaproteobacteria bacterium]|nr:arabinose-5-phosphate isomerase [Alphaproteobacteria bacterium]
MPFNIGLSEVAPPRGLRCHFKRKTLRFTASVRLNSPPRRFGAMPPDPQRVQIKRAMAKTSVRDDNKSGQSHSFIESALRTLDAEAGGVTALAAAIHGGLGQPFIAAVEMIREAKGRVIVSGMGKSGHVARKIAATFASTGTPAFFVHPGEASHGDLGMIAPDDVIIALSWSGETAELKSLIDYSRRFRIGLVAVTADGASTLGAAADVTLVLPQAREACPHNLAPTTSSLMQLALGDAVAIALLESRGFTAVDFGMLHPGGRLGALLKFVRDIMHGGKSIPLVARGTKMSNAVIEMSAKGFGCIGITDADGKLLGIITDGDLRRHMRRDLFEASVDEIMTHGPKTIRPDQLVSEALELLNSMNITALFVVDAGRPIGIVHIHDLLRAGAA